MKANYFLKTAVSLLLLPLSLYSQSFRDCSELTGDTRIFEISPTSSSGNSVPPLSFEYLFYNIPATNFEFTEGQFRVDHNSASLYGTLTLTSGGNTNNPIGSEWLIYLEFTPNASGSPDTELGQGAELTDTWKYFQLNEEGSYMYNTARTFNIAHFQEGTTQLQMGVGANNKDISSFGATASYYVNLGSGSGSMDLFIDLDFACETDARTCEDIADTDELYSLNSSTNNGSVVHSLAIANAFGSGTATFDFTSGQLHYNDTGGSLYGELTLSSGGGGLDGTSWKVNIPLHTTDIIDPRADIGQGEDRIATWVYYLISSDQAYLYQTDNPNRFLSLEQLSSPFQIGIGAGGQDINELSASGEFTWSNGNETGTGMINVNIEDLCPPDITITPFLECVTYRSSDNMYVADFGYENDGSENIIIPAGEQNLFTPGPADRGQIFNFLPGRHENAFGIEFDGSQLEWSLTSPDGTVTTVVATNDPATLCEVAPEPPTATLSGTAEICEGTTTLLEVALTGEAPWTLSYKVSGTTKTKTIQNSPYQFSVTEEGEYSLVSVSDRNGVSGTVSGTATISYHEKPSATLSGKATICSNTTGELSLELTGTAPWTVSYTDGTEVYKITTSENSNSILATEGTYELTEVTDANCSGTITGTATIQEADPTATISGGGDICQDGPVAVNISLTGTAPWQVTWTDGTDTHELEVSEESYSFTTATAGTYQLLSMRDANCPGVVEGVAVVKDVAPTATISGGGELCGPKSAASISISLTGQAPWNVSYTDGSNVYELEIHDEPYTFQTTTEGRYELIKVSDSHCEGTVSGTAPVSVLPPLAGDITTAAAYCPGSIPLTADLTGEPTTIQWSVSGSSGSIENSNRISATFHASESDSVLTFRLHASDGCSELELEKPVTIIRLDATFFVTPVADNNTLLQGTEYVFVPVLTTADTYSWDFGDGSIDDAVSPMHIFTETGTYTVSLTVSQEDCIDTFTSVFEVIENRSLYIPNVFNPTSSNSENNVVKVYGENISPDNFSFRIFNRWGKVVYSTDNLANAQNHGWDGRTNDEDQGNNVFTYIVRGSYNDGRGFEKTGTVTLVR